MTLDAFSLAEILLIVAVIGGAAFVHGIIGFGFPIMAMPILATAFDTKTAVLVTIVPIIAIITISSVRGGNLRRSVGRFWFLPVFTTLGGVVGTRLFMVAPTSLLTLLLAIFILTYLLLDRFGPGRFEFVHRHWVPFAAVFAFGAGITETTVNIGVPLVLIYFMLAGVETLAMVQALNFVFLFSKIVQIIGLMISGTLPPASAARAVAAHRRRGACRCCSACASATASTWRPIAARCASSSGSPRRCCSRAGARRPSCRRPCRAWTGRSSTARPRLTHPARRRGR